MWGLGLDRSGSGQGQVTGICEGGNELSGSIKVTGICEGGNELSGSIKCG